MNSLANIGVDSDLGFADARKPKLRILVLLALVVAGLLVGCSPKQNRDCVYRIRGAIHTPVALVPNGAIVFAAADMCVYSINRTGSLLWRFSLAPTGGIPSAPSAAADGTVYFGATDRGLYALTAAGLLKWRFQASAPITSGAAVSQSGEICFVADDGSFYALSQSGALLWTARVGTNSYYAPAGANGTVYVAAMDGKLHALAAAGPQWQVSFNSPLLGLALSSNVVYVGSEGDGLIAVDLTGKYLWAFGASSPIGYGIAVGEDGMIFTASSEGKCYGLSPAGTRVWECNIHESIESGPVVTAKGHMYICAGPGNLYRIAPTGTVEQVFNSRRAQPSGSYEPGSPLIAPDRVIWWASWSGEVYAVSTDETLAESMWPLAGHDPGRTSATRPPLGSSSEKVSVLRSKELPEANVSNAE